MEIIHTWITKPATAKKNYSSNGFLRFVGSLTSAIETTVFEFWLFSFLTWTCVHSQKRHRANASYGFHLDASLLSSHINRACSPHQFCENQTWSKLLKPPASSLSLKSLDNQLASSLSTTCSRLVIIKPKQEIRTHPDIGLMTAKQQACSRPSATCASLAG